MTKLRLSIVAICYRNGIRTNVLKFIAARCNQWYDGSFESENESNEFLGKRSHNRNVVEVIDCNVRVVWRERTE